MNKHIHYLPFTILIMKTTYFTNTVRVLHVSPQKCTAYGNPTSLYIFQRIENLDNLNTFEAKNEPNSDALCNLRQGDIVKLLYRRRGKSWDFLAVDYVDYRDPRFPTAFAEHIKQ